MLKKNYLLPLCAFGSLGLLAAGAGSLAMAHSSVPDGLEQSLTRTTRGGEFQVRIEPTQRPIPLYRIHSWTAVVTDREGRPVSGAIIKVDGGMPQHGHGLPTRPVAIAGDAPGTYLIEGLKFSMDGWWELKLDIAASGSSDAVTFNIVL